MVVASVSKFCSNRWVDVKHWVKKNIGAGANGGKTAPSQELEAFARVA